MKPLAKKTNVFAEKLPQEVVLYDKTNYKVHCLSKTAAAVWESSDGTRTIDELTSVVEAKSGVPAERQLVALAVDELQKAGRCKPAVVLWDAAQASRREAMGKIALAGTALVATLVASAPEAHASTMARRPCRRRSRNGLAIDFQPE